MITIARAALLLVASTAMEAKAGTPESRADESAVAAARPAASAGPDPWRAEHKRPPRLYVSANRLIGTAVYGPEEKRIGTVRDVLFREDGRASAIIISSARWLRGLPRYYRAPWSAVEFASDGGVSSTLVATQLTAYPWTGRGDAVRENEMRARTILRSKVLLENRSRYGNVRDLVFDRNGNMWGLVIVPLPKLGDRRGDRAPHVYSSPFDVDLARRRITVPYGSDDMPRGGAF